MSTRLILAMVAGSLMVLGAAGFSQDYLMEPPEEESGFSGRLDMNVSSQYIWRGVEFNPEAVLQPFLFLNERGLEVGGRGTLDLTDANGMKGNFSDWGWRAGLAKRSPGGAFGLFYNYYAYRGERPKTQEVGLELAWGNPLFFGLDVYWDFDAADGFYGRPAVGYAYKSGILGVIPKFSMGMSTRKYQEYYFGDGADTLLDLQVTLGVEVEVTEGIFIVGEGSYYELMSAALRRARTATARGERFWGGGGVSLRF